MENYHEQIHLYLLSGVGADRRAFKRLTFPDSVTVHYIDWIPPYKHESMRSYASRLSVQVNTHQSFVLSGVSFGGMIAAEMSTLINPLATIIISGASHVRQIPQIFRIAGKFGVRRVIPAALLKKSNKRVEWLFGVQSAEEKELLKHILADTDEVFLKWALNAIPEWERFESPKGIFQIHGSADRILPVPDSTDVVVNDGGHLMVLTRADEVSLIIQNHLANLGK
jgi:pimeloyl-ACP methyl ester carboxylesterase